MFGSKQRLKFRMIAIFFAVITFFTYAPALTTGFFAQDYDFLEPVARLDTIPYLIRAFDPRLQTLWYRPMQAVQILLEYWAFGSDPIGYHVLNVAFHIVSALLLCALVARVSRKILLGFLSALFYFSFPVYALAVNWINITDPLMSIFYLGGIWFWLNYFERGEARDYVLTLILFVVALLIKQMAITLPAILFLVEYVLLGRRVDAPRALRRYAAFGSIVAPFALLQYAVQSTHVFASVFGYSLGAQFASVLIQYLSLMVFPWGYFPPTDTQITEGLPFVEGWNLVWLMLAAAIYTFIAIRSRSRALAFLALAAFVILLPVLPFPFIELRYLYLPTMISAIVLALWSERVFISLNSSRGALALGALGLGLLLIGNAFSVASANAGLNEIARQRRVPFRDISRQRPAFAEGTHLYFIESVSPLPELSGMFLMRYGRGVTVGGDTARQVTHPRDYPHAFVYYSDETGKPLEVEVEQTALAAPALPLPILYGDQITLNHLEIAQSRIKRGGVLIALLYWHATREIARDYTVFVHLVDRTGKIVASVDRQPHNGELPTRQWRIYVPVADSVVMPVPIDISPGDDYRLEIGLYHLPTNMRLMIANADGVVLDDKLIVSPIAIVE